MPSGLHEIEAHASTQCIACCQPVRRCSRSFEHKIHKMDSVLNSCDKNLLTDTTSEQAKTKDGREAKKPKDKSSKSRSSSQTQSKSSVSSGHVEARGVKKSVDSMAGQQSSTASQGNQDSIAVFMTAITQALSDIKNTMQSGFAGLGHQIQAQLQDLQNPYDSQTEECSDGIVDVCHATGSKDQAGIIADEDPQAEEPSKKKRRLNSGEAEDS